MIHITDEDVRGTPQELIDFRAGLTEEDVESPRKYRKMVSSSRFRTFMK